MTEDLVARAKAIIAEHESNVAAGDLDAIMSNMAPDIVVMAPDSPLVEGSEACRAMYAALLEMGTWEFRHDYGPAAVFSGAVFLHGVARGTLTLNDGSSQPLANNFQITLRPGSDGRMKAWRVAFAPDGS